MLKAYRQHAAEREALGVPALPLNAQQTSDLCKLLENPPGGEEEFLMHLLVDRIPPGVDDASYVKADFLAAIAKETVSSPLITPNKAVEILGTMMGGYNVQSLVEFLSDKRAAIAQTAADALSKT